MPVDIFHTDSWQTKIDANPPGTIFNIKRTGIHTKARNLTAKLNQEFNGEVGPGGEVPIVDGGFDLNKRFIRSTTTGVKVRDLEVRHYFLSNLQDRIIDFAPATGTEPSYGQGNSAIRIHAHHCIGALLRPGKGGTADDCDLHNAYMALGGGSFCEIKNSHWHDLNNPDPVLQPHYQKMVDDQLGDYIKLRADSSGMWTVLPGFQAGFKFAKSTGVKVYTNEVGPSINAPGIWFDISNIDYEIFDNWLHDSPYSGAISIEISYGGKIYRNLCERLKTDPIARQGTNRWAIGIHESVGSASKKIEVYENRVLSCGGGIGMRQGTGRFDDLFPDGVTYARVSYLDAHHNDIEFCNTLAGITGGMGAPLTDKATYHNEYDYNRYRSNKAEPFTGDRSFAEWQAIPQDANGSYNATAPPTSRHGSCIINIPFSVTGVGRKRGKGQSSVSVGLTVTGSGAQVTPPVALHGFSVVPTLMEVTPVGRVGKKGTSTAPIAFGVTAMGHKEPVPPPPIGTSSVDVSFGVTARGRKRGRGKSTISLEFAPSIEGEILTRGSSQVDVGFAVAGVGKKGAHSPRDEFGDPISVEVGVAFGTVAVGQGLSNTARNGSCTIPLLFDVLSELEDEDDPERHGTPGKKGLSSVAVAMAVNAVGHGQTSGGSGGPPPPPGGPGPSLLPEEYKTTQRRTAQEGFS